MTRSRDRLSPGDVERSNAFLSPRRPEHAVTVIPVQHDSYDWHALRASHIGASECAGLFDLPRDQRPNYMLTRFALWHIKSCKAPAPHVDNPRARWGIKLEEVIAQAAAEQEGWTISKGGYVIDATTPGLGCTLDFIIAADQKEDGPGVLEVKAVDWLVHRRSWTDDEPPPYVLIQLMHQLAATGYTWGCVGALVGGNDLWLYRYKARYALVAEIRRRVMDFWASIAGGTPPPVDGSESASAVLASLYPEIVDDAIDMSLSNEWSEAAHAFFNAGEARRLANSGYDEAKNQIVALLAGHKRGYGGGWQINTSITPGNPGREPNPGELVGKRAETRRYTIRETTKMGAD